MRHPRAVVHNWTPETSPPDPGLPNPLRPADGSREFFRNGFYGVAPQLKITRLLVCRPVIVNRKIST